MIRLPRWREYYNQLHGLTMARLVSMEDAADRGQHADVQWLYRHISPVWRQDECDTLDGGKVRPRRLTNAAVTNSPNLFGMLPLSNSHRPSSVPPTSDLRPPTSSASASASRLPTPAPPLSSAFASLRLCVPPSLSSDLGPRTSGCLRSLPLCALRVSVFFLRSAFRFQVSAFIHPSLLANTRQRRAVFAKLRGAPAAATRSSAYDQPLTAAQYDAKVAADARAAGRRVSLLLLRVFAPLRAPLPFVGPRPSVLGLPPLSAPPLRPPRLRVNPPTLGTLPRPSVQPLEDLEDRASKGFTCASSCRTMGS